MDIIYYAIPTKLKNKKIKQGLDADTRVQEMITFFNRKVKILKFQKFSFKISPLLFPYPTFVSLEILLLTNERK